MNSARVWRAVGAHNSAKQSVNLQVYPANTLELAFHFRCRVTVRRYCPRVYEILTRDDHYLYPCAFAQ